MIEAYPLAWPPGRTRTKRPQSSRFDRKMTTGRAQHELNQSLSRLKAVNIVISTNVPTRKDGQFYASAKSPEDCGVAVYFNYKGSQKCFSCDKYTYLKDNIWAIAKTIEAIRGIERWGTGEMVDAAFSGFDALPSPDSVHHKMWWETLEISREATESEITKAYRRLASIHHPDRGGEHSKFVEIQKAYEEATRRNA